jgi:uncharacterized protein YhaN
MRLNRLDLIYYGIFTDIPIDFGEVVAGEPDLHIIYGPNEAGKSTAFSAWLDLLFKIETRSRYNFRHEKTMQVGADLLLSTGRKTLKRIKTNQNSLLDESGRPVLDTVLQAELMGLSRESYATAFSLDERVLQDGGREIINSKGDLGKLLYGATAGLSDLSKKLKGIRDKSEEIFKKGGNRHKIADFKNKLAELKTQKDAIDTLATTYDRLVLERDQKEGTYIAALTDLGAAKKRLKEVTHFLAAHPHLNALHHYRAQLAAHLDFPEPPAKWFDEITTLQSDETKFTALFDDAQIDVESARQLLDTTEVNETALKAEARLKELDFMKARHLLATKDIPTVTEQANATGAEIATILNRLEQTNHPEPSLLIVGPTLQNHIRKLIEAKIAIEGAEKSAKDEEAKAQTLYDTATARLAEAGGQSMSDTQIAVFSLGVGEIQLSDHEARLRLATQTKSEKEELLDQQLSQLKPWNGKVEDLARMAVPPTAELQRWKTSLAAATTLYNNTESELGRLDNEHKARLAIYNSLKTRSGVAAGQEASIVRAAREKAWARHRQNFVAETADAFEEALRHDDFVTTERHINATEIAGADQAKLEVDKAQQAANQGKEPLNKATIGLDTIKSEIASAIQIKTPGLPADLTLIEWEEWLARRATAVETWQSVLNAQREIDTARIDGAEAHRKLLATFEDAGLPQDPTTKLSDMLRLAQAMINTGGQIKALRQAASDSERSLHGRTEQYANAKAAREAWEDRWKSACQSCWLGGTAAVPSTEAVSDILKEIPTLGAAVAKKVEYLRRIEAMRQDQLDFETQVASLAAELGVLHNPDKPLDTAYAIDQLVQAAKTARDDRAKKRDDLHAAQSKLARNEDELKTIDATKRAMTEFFGVASLVEVAAALNQAKERTKLKENVVTAEREILTATGFGTIEEAEAALTGKDRSELGLEQQELEAGTDQKNNALLEIFAAKTDAQKKIDEVGGDDAVAKIEVNRRALQMEIEYSAVEYLKLRIGALAAEQGLRLYREEHRSSMMKNAADAFKIVSRGQYIGLSTQPEKDAEILIVKGADGSTKFADDLSTGTRLQLYLALRVAGYQEFAANRPPLPFIADDIMESFDDFRAEEAFRLFAKMADLGQVIYLTHHQHLIPIARQVCPTIRVHNLTTA